MTNLTKLNDKEKEPVMDCVKDADKDEKNVGVAADRLRSIIERIERREEEKKALADDIRDIFSEAKSAGFETKAIRAVLKIRKMDPSDREEQEHWIETYKKALDI